MKIKPMLFAVSTCVILTTTPLQAGWQGGNTGTGGQQGAAKQKVATLSNNEINSLLFMREEEKLARDVYISLFDEWAHPVFDNISSAEQKHMNALKNQLDKYALADPIEDNTIGIFQNDTLATLYQDLLTQGIVSLEQAFYVGALIEELDIQDLREAINESTHSDIVRTYENLMRGSRNHLRAFVGQIENLGIVYEAQLMSQDEVDEIVNSDTERGGKKRGKRPGRR